MITGRQALATVEQAIGRARNEENRLDVALRAAAEEAARLRAERMDAFRELARLKLDEALLGKIDSAEARALALIDEGRRRLEQLLQQRAEAQHAAEKAEAERHARAADYEEAVKALHELRGRVEGDALVTAAWAAQRARIDELRQVAGRAEAKAAQAELDREVKRKPYDADPLFKYLWQRRYGSGDYKAGRLIKYADSRIANLIGYDQARGNYALLNAIPARLREHVVYVQQELQAEQTRLRTIEREALVSAGIEPLESRAATTKVALETAEKNLVERRETLSALDREHDSAVNGAGSPYRQAIEVLATADAAQDLTTLFAEALQTASPKDEAVLGKIEETEKAIGRAEQESGAIRKEMTQLAYRRSRIEHERDEFHRKGYDNPYGTFGNEQVLSKVLGGILGGVLQATVLRDVLNRGYRAQVGPWDSDFGGRNAHFPSGGDGRDGFSTGGSF
jgi:hypothetical protein